MSETPLTDKALEKLKAMVDGNGLAADDIVLLGTDEKVFSLRGEMHLSLEVVREKSTYPGPLRNAKNISASKLQKVQSEAQGDEAAKTLTEKLGTDGKWVKEAVGYLKEQPGEGWGIENADVTLDELSQLSYLQSNCPSCNGNGAVDCIGCQGQGQLPCTYCRGTGFEPCINCNGSGVNATNPGQYCLYCNGSTQQPCRQCRGTRQMSCTNCRGKAKITCNNCNGQGSFTTEDSQVPTAHARFHLVQSVELPSGFRRAIARGGLKSLTRGHGTMTMLPAEDRDKTNAVVPYKADIPFADVRLRIAGKAVRASVLGKKAILLDMPPFLDTALEPNIKNLEAAITAPDSLNKALAIRAVRDALGLIQQGRGEAKALRGLYSSCLSPEMAARIFALVRALMNEQTKIMRLAAGAGAVLVTAGLSFLLIKSGIRLGIAAAAAPLSVIIFDLLFCGLCVYAQNAILRYVAARQLQLRLGAAADAPRLGMASQKAGMIGVVVGALCALTYLALLFILGAEPSWPVIAKRPFG